MKKTYILSLFSVKGALVGLVVLAGFMLNFAFTISPTKTQAVFGNEDNSYRFVLSQGSGTVLTNDSLGIDPLSTEEINSPVITASDSVVADGLSLLPAKKK